ncbi:hypothetical protein CTAYLR_008780 [Chrysophaeum taylorii]|uniref:Uncharacterized protein n=1 Tax=Chrysophaeum taylorii TaxID=2483200 RepID=A0AAD7UPF9_9STRA|nr:hypothetical protein CTAYLR_008780 [Chrysophaeum taylorii]
MAPCEVIVEVVFANNKAAKIHVRKGDSPRALATAFLNPFGLSEYVPMLAKQIEAAIEDQKTPRLTPKEQKEARARLYAKKQQQPKAAAASVGVEAVSSMPPPPKVSARRQRATCSRLHDEHDRLNQKVSKMQRRREEEVVVKPFRISARSRSLARRARPSSSKLESPRRRKDEWSCPKCGHLNQGGSRCERPARFEKLADACPSAWAYCDTQRFGRAEVCGMPRPRDFEPTIVSCKSRQLIDAWRGTENVWDDLYSHAFAPTVKAPEEIYPFEPTINETSRAIASREKRVEPPPPPPPPPPPEPSVDPAKQRRTDERLCYEYEVRRRREAEQAEARARKLLLDAERRSASVGRPPLAYEEARPVHNFLYRESEARDARKRERERRALVESQEAATTLASEASRAIVDERRRRAFGDMFEALVDLTREEKLSLQDLADPQLDPVKAAEACGDLDCCCAGLADAARRVLRRESEPLGFDVFFELMNSQLRGPAATKLIFPPAPPAVVKRLEEEEEEEEEAEPTFKPALVATTKLAPQRKGKIEDTLRSYAHVYRDRLQDRRDELERHRAKDLTFRPKVTRKARAATDYPLALKFRGSLS